MKIVLHENFVQCADQTFDAARLRRNGVHSIRDRVFAGVLAKLEAGGEAMRFVDTNGRIAWKATPSLCQYLKNLALDAKGGCVTNALPGSGHPFFNGSVESKSPPTAK